MRPQVMAGAARRAGYLITGGIGHRRSTLTSLLDRLEGRGWVRRAAHPTSRRLVLVDLTGARRPVAERVRDALRELEGRVPARAGGDGVAALRRVIEVLEEELR